MLLRFLVLSIIIFSVKAQDLTTPIPFDVQRDFRPVFGTTVFADLLLREYNTDTGEFTDQSDRYRTPFISDRTAPEIGTLITSDRYSNRFNGADGFISLDTVSNLETLSISIQTNTKSGIGITETNRQTVTGNFIRSFALIEDTLYLFNSNMLGSRPLDNSRVSLDTMIDQTGTSFINDINQDIRIRAQLNVSTTTPLAFAQNGGSGLTITKKGDLIFSEPNPAMFQGPTAVIFFQASTNDTQFGSRSTAQEGANPISIQLKFALSELPEGYRCISASGKFPGCDDAVSNDLCYSLKDSDGDALYDDWEINGIDSNCDGTIDLILSGANPNKKDIFVEVDWMDGFEPPMSLLQRVVNAFKKAPESIALHIMKDEVAINFQQYISFKQQFPNTLSFQDIKKFRFGTAQERSNPQTIEAKDLAFHYGLFVNAINESNSLGKAEIIGDDFVVSLGSFLSTPNVKQTVINSAIAGTFMHELGHNLGLKHGGDTDINCKPNYLSIMNYSHQIAGYPIFGRRLDYSRNPLSTLNEDMLNEKLGVGGPIGEKTIFGPGNDINGNSIIEWYEYPIVDTDKSIDWNQNNVEREILVAADINNLVGFTTKCNGEGKILEGFDDWDNIVYNFRETPNFKERTFRKGVIASSSEELTFDELINFPIDTDRDGLVNMFDNCMGIANEDQIDTDNDDIGDECDNCPVKFNPYQEDFNENGVGDICEISDSADIYKDNFEADSQ